jgi:hypothetical protein
MPSLTDDSVCGETKAYCLKIIPLHVDRAAACETMGTMNPPQKATAPSLEEADAQAVLDHVATGAPLDPEVARRVRERAERVREEVFRRHGVVDLGVPAIRELRGELPEP